VTALGLASAGEGASRRRAEQLAAERLLAQLPADMLKFP
jgi:dsRNA-specific ribonuclease